jgi:phenylalanyl-tRNA synthetase alpha subunit
MTNKSASVNREYKQHSICLNEIKRMADEGSFTLNKAVADDLNATLKALYASPQMKQTYENLITTCEKHWEEINAAIAMSGMQEMTKEEIETLVYNFSELYNTLKELAEEPGFDYLGLTERLDKLKGEMEASSFGQEMLKANRALEMASNDSLN